MPDGPKAVSTYQEYRDVYPRSDGPPPLKAYTGAKVVSAQRRIYTLELDEGAYRAIWELLEAECIRRWPVRGSMASVRAYLRGVKSFRETYWASNPKPEPKAVSPAPKAKSVARRKALAPKRRAS